MSIFNTLDQKLTEKWLGVPLIFLFFIPVSSWLGVPFKRPSIFHPQLRSSSDASILAICMHTLPRSEIIFFCCTSCLKHSSLRNQVIQHPLILQIITYNLSFSAVLLILCVCVCVCVWDGEVGGSGSFISNTYSLHCHHQNDSA